MDKRRKEEDRDCKKQALAGWCVFWGNMRCLVVVLRRNTKRVTGRIGGGQVVMLVPAYGGDRSVIGQQHR